MPQRPSPVSYESRWSNVLRLMDAVPQHERRLLHKEAWNPWRRCGCIVGTLCPAVPRGVRWDCDFRHVLRHPGVYAWDVSFAAWCREVGIQEDDLTYLQTINDCVPAMDVYERWDVVHEYVRQRATGVTHGAALHAALQ